MLIQVDSAASQAYITLWQLAVQDLLMLKPPILLPIFAADVLVEIRRGFELQRTRSAPYDIKYALSNGRTRLRMLEEAIGFSR